MGLLNHIFRAVSGDAALAQDIKNYGEPIDILLSWIISIAGLFGVFIITSLLLFRNLQQNIGSALEGLDASAQSMVGELIPSTFGSYILSNIWMPALLIIGIAVFWFISAGLIHLFGVILKGNAKFIHILIFSSLLLPLIILFSSTAILFTLSMFIGTGLFITLGIILAIVFIIILLRALINGISALYSISMTGSIFIIFATAIIYSLVGAIIWSMMI